MKILVINCGSSSLKYQLIDMEGEKVLCKGLCERIGMESSMITHEANGHKATTPAIFPTHTEAFTEVVKKMTTGEGKVIDSVSEIDAIGHRVVRRREVQGELPHHPRGRQGHPRPEPAGSPAQPRRHPGHRGLLQGLWSGQAERCGL